MRPTITAALVALVVLTGACASDRTTSTERTTEGLAPASATDRATPAATETPATEPSLRGYHRMVEAGGLGTILLGGYFTEGPPGCCAEDVAWKYSTARGWTDLGLRANRLPPQVSNLDDAAYDTRSRMVVIYSMDGVFTYDPAANTAEPTRSEAPLGMFAARMAYDTASDRIVLFGGNAETWSYDVDTDTWTRMSPDVSPPARSWHGMAYDAGEDLIVLFGGFDVGETLLGDTWTYDLEADAWTQVRTRAAPAPRAYFDMTYVPTIGRTILFGGISGSSWEEEPNADTWAFDAVEGRWIELAPGSGPTPRAWHAMAYDATGKVVVLFGGGPSRTGYTAETWIYDPRADAWSRSARP